MLTRPIVFATALTTESQIYSLRFGSAERTPCLIGCTLMASSRTLSGRDADPCIYPQIPQLVEMLKLHKKHPQGFNAVHLDITQPTWQARRTDLEELLNKAENYMDAIQFTEPEEDLLQYAAQNYSHLTTIVEIKNSTLRKTNPGHFAQEIRNRYGKNLDMLVLGEALSSADALPDPQLLEQFLDALFTSGARCCPVIAADARKMEDYAGLVLKFPEISITAGITLFNDGRFSEQFGQDYIRCSEEIYGNAREMAPLLATQGQNVLNISAQA